METIYMYCYDYYSHFTALWILSGTTQNQSGFPGARDSEWQRDQLDHMEICTSLQTDNHASTPPLVF